MTVLYLFLAVFNNFLVISYVKDDKSSHYINTLTPLYLLQLLIVIPLTNLFQNDDMIGFYRLIRHVLLSFSFIPNWHSSYSLLYDESKYDNTYLNIIDIAHKDMITGMVNPILIFLIIVITLLIIKMTIKLNKLCCKNRTNT